MSNLQKIQQLAAGFRKSLASLTSSGDSEDLDKIARERVFLREKLDLLAEAETAERERLEAEEAAIKAKRRRAFLQSVAKKAETAGNHYQALTNRSISLLRDLVVVLAEREQAFNRAAVGLDTPEAYDLSSEERSYLIDMLERSTLSIYKGQFAATWKAALQQIEDSHIRNRLSDLLPLPESYHTPLSGVQDLLADTARTLAESEPPKKPAPSSQASTTKRAGQRYVADLRSSGPVIDLDAE